MQIFYARIVAWLSAGVLTIWTSYKAFWVTAFLAFLATVLYSLFLYGVQDMLNSFTLLIQKSGGQTGSVVGQFTGLAGWLLICFKVPQSLVFAIDIILLKWTLRKIPFIKW